MLFKTAKKKAQDPTCSIAASRPGWEVCGDEFSQIKLRSTKKNRVQRWRCKPKTALARRKGGRRRRRIAAAPSKKRQQGGGKGKRGRGRRRRSRGICILNKSCQPGKSVRSVAAVPCCLLMAVYTDADHQ